MIRLGMPFGPAFAKLSVSRGVTARLKYLAFETPFRPAVILVIT